MNKTLDGDAHRAAAAAAAAAYAATHRQKHQGISAPGQRLIESADKGPNQYQHSRDLTWPGASTAAATAGLGAQQRREANASLAESLVQSSKSQAYGFQPHTLNDQEIHDFAHQQVKLPRVSLSGRSDGIAASSGIASSGGTAWLGGVGSSGLDAARSSSGYSSRSIDATASAAHGSSAGSSSGHALQASMRQLAEAASHQAAFSRRLVDPVQQPASNRVKIVPPAQGYTQRGQQRKRKPPSLAESITRAIADATSFGSGEAMPASSRQAIAQLMYLRDAPAAKRGRKPKRPRIDQGSSQSAASSAAATASGGSSSSSLSPSSSGLASDVDDDRNNPAIEAAARAAAAAAAGASVSAAGGFAASQSELGTGLPVLGSSSSSSTVSMSAMGWAGTQHMSSKVCSVCNKSISSKANLARHLMNVHLKSRPHVCPVPGCGKSFAQETHLSLHVRSVHQKERNYECPHCRKRFSRVGGLQLHVNVKHMQANGQQYECETCSKKFGQRAQLMQHIRRAHGGGADDLLASGNGDSAPVMATRDSQTDGMLTGTSASAVVATASNAASGFICPLQGCTVLTRSLEEFRKHCSEAHKDLSGAAEAAGLVAVSQGTVSSTPVAPSVAAASVWGATTRFDSSTSLQNTPVGAPLQGSLSSGSGHLAASMTASMAASMTAGRDPPRVPPSPSAQAGTAASGSYVSRVVSSDSLPRLSSASHQFGMQSTTSSASAGPLPAQGGSAGVANSSSMHAATETAAELAEQAAISAAAAAAIQQQQQQQKQLQGHLVGTSPAAAGSTPDGAGRESRAEAGQTDFLI